MISLLMLRSKAEVRAAYYGDKEEYMRQKGNCNRWKGEGDIQ